MSAKFPSSEIRFGSEKGGYMKYGGVMFFCCMKPLLKIMNSQTNNIPTAYVCERNLNG